MLSVYALPKEHEFNAQTVIKIMSGTNISELKAKALTLIDASTGQVLYEKNSDERLPIASVTKVMSMLLIMEALDSGRISMEDMVTTSEYAAGMGGSQAYIEQGEQFQVKEALKAVALHSSNDVTVSLAELVAGSEESFVVMMNEKAKELGMKNTKFLDCTGLTDIDHYSSAHDVALMSRELVTKHPRILEFTSIWMDTFRDGKFELVNTNRLVRFYKGEVDGLKTGFTNAAGFCLAATAKRNGMRLISVVLGEADTNTRFAESKKLLDYGFANYESIQVNNKGDEVSEFDVKKGINRTAKALYANDVKLLLSRGEKGNVKNEVKLEESISAPVKTGQKVGEVIYSVNDKEIARVDLVSDRDVDKASFGRLFVKMVLSWFNVGR
ncbi:MAG: D-alanyl-D-alanine carboxypeptidase [Clostridiaceae bacterium]|nr:D-alanyl-D-alanine carboxypeptidase [Clostridiaceae bacterium]